jgi:hypothetical protein
MKAVRYAIQGYVFIHRLMTPGRTFIFTAVRLGSRVEEFLGEIVKRGGLPRPLCG